MIRAESGEEGEEPCPVLLFRKTTVIVLVISGRRASKITSTFK
jgi:hypothetical protein